MDPKEVVIIGGGFAGLNAAKSLAHLPIHITLIDRNNYHLFQPLLYQVATAGLSSVDIAHPIRRILKKHQNIEVLMAEVERIIPTKKQLVLAGETLDFDYLILAPGSHYNYFKHPEWSKDAPSLKTIPDALLIRRKVLTAFERAEMSEDPQVQKAFLTFVVVGGGPTGVELAGSIAELAHHTLAKDFRRINPASARILLVEAGPRILGPFPEDLADKARVRLIKMGVEVKEKCMVEDVSAQGVRVEGQFVPAQTVLWCAGVLASPLLGSLGLELDRGGRVPVKPDLSIEGSPDIFVLGDAAHFEQDGKPLPGLAPVAIQQGRHMAKILASRLKGEGDAPPFKYFDKGTMATVGKSFAVAQVRKWKTAGFRGWLIWVFVHILYLVGFQNRAMVLFQWAWQYFNFDRGARVITQELPPEP